MCNRSSTRTLRLIDSGLEWGKWTEDAPKSVAPEMTAAGPHSSGRQGSASGTQGYVTYQLGDDPDDWAKFSRDVPWLAGAANTYRTDVGSKRIFITVDGWHGSGASEAPVVEIGMVA
jgi:hypothetical protein